MAACCATNLLCLSPFEVPLATCANDNCCIEVSTGHNPGRDHDVLGTFLPESFRSGQSLTKDCKHVGSAFALSATATEESLKASRVSPGVLKRAKHGGGGKGLSFV